MSRYVAEQPSGTAAGWLTGSPLARGAGLAQGLQG